MSVALMSYLTRRQRSFVVQILSKKVSNQIKTVRDERLKLRRDFREKEKEWEEAVDLGKLNDVEKQIYRLHKLACKEFKHSYVDPISGYNVFTRYKHFIRGKCCGNGCRHCPFNMIAADETTKSTRRFNSAFYIDS